MIVITGRGALTPLGDNPTSILEALQAAKSAVVDSTTSDGAPLGVARIADFDSAKYAKIRGMRMYNRATQLAICAVKLALTEAKIDETNSPSDDLGLLMASSYGHLDTLIDYDRSLVQNGLQRTNAALMPLSIPSAPGAMTALAFGAKAFSMTLCDGAASFLDALALGARWLEEGRARMCIVVGSFSPSADVLLAVSRAGGITQVGEGAVAFILESAEDAAKRGVSACGELRGYGTAFASPKASAENAAGALQRATHSAFNAASTSADRAVPAASTKSAFGETFDAGAGLDLLVALNGKPGSEALITARSGAGSCSAVVVSVSASISGHSQGETS